MSALRAGSLAALALSGCSASVAINAVPNSAEIYITDYAPNPNTPPASYEARGTGSLYADVEYFAWEEFYMWVGAPGYATQVGKLRNEPKIGPIIGGVFCFWPALIWSYGPDEGPYQVDLQPAAPTQVPADQPLAIPGF